MEEHKDCWSDCSQVLFTGGKGYGVAEDLRTICLGTEVAIKKSFETGEIDDQLTPIERQTLAQILAYRKEQGIGIRESDMVGASDDGTSGRKQEAISKTKKGQRLTRRSSHKKHSHLFRR